MLISAVLIPANFPIKSHLHNNNMIPLTKTHLISHNFAALSYQNHQNMTEIGLSQDLHITIVKERSSTHDYKLQSMVKLIKNIMKSMDTEKQVDELIMIDAIQRLGLEYYFQEDIHRVFEKHHLKVTTMDEDGGNLHDVALRFRLLRHAGYNVSEGMFDKFVGEDTKLRKDLRNDTQGLMSLFEASQLRIPGDHILEDATQYCELLLQTNLKNVAKQSEARIIQNTLSNPFHKSLPRLLVDLYNFENSLKIIHDCCGINDWIEEILNLAKMDANEAQITHMNEITYISGWWNELRLTEKLKLARSEPVKWHLWSLVVLPSPNMAQLRIELTKVISFIYIIDDIFDVYGTLQDLTLFTEAVNRWDLTNIEKLPEYMTMCLKALYNTTDEISKGVYLNHGWNPKAYLQKAWAELCNAFLVEAKWFASGELPSTDEYMKNGVVSSGVYVVAATIFSLLGDGVNNTNTQFFNNHSHIVTSAAKILRLWDDLKISKDENSNGHDGSYIACYVKQHKDRSGECARQHVFEMISDEWKWLNQECLSDSPFSTDFKTALLNLARMVPIMYSRTHHLPSVQ